MHVPKSSSPRVPNKYNALMLCNSIKERLFAHKSGHTMMALEIHCAL